MTIDTNDTAVRFSVTIDAPRERAFAAFTEQYDEVKPREHTLLTAPIAESVFEQRVGGTVYDRGEDGSECHWGRVLAFDPPERLVFTWDISPEWTLETDHARCSEVEVTFVSVTPDQTRVDLEHRHLDRHGDGWMSLREGIGGEGGWPLYLKRYVELA